MDPVGVVVPEEVVEVTGGTEVLPEETGGVLPPYVEPIGPYLMFENVTDALGWFATTSSGSPVVVAQAPRETPGSDGLLSRG